MSSRNTAVVLNLLQLRRGDSIKFTGYIKSHSFWEKRIPEVMVQDLSPMSCVVEPDLILY